MPQILTKQPTRMCIVCRGRESQEKLFRLQCQEKRLIPYSGVGRSFYLCESCLEHKKTASALARQCKSGDTEVLLSQLKEITTNDR